MRVGVTDERTRPLEFRVTDPVETTELQKVLYGAVLDEHLLGELCGVPLLDALREDADYVLVRDEALLSLQDTCDRPVLWLGRDEDVLLALKEQCWRVTRANMAGWGA